MRSHIHCINADLFSYRKDLHQQNQNKHCGVLQRSLTLLSTESSLFIHVNSEFHQLAEEGARSGINTFLSPLNGSGQHLANLKAVTAQIPYQCHLSSRLLGSLKDWIEPLDNIDWWLRL